MSEDSHTQVADKREAPIRIVLPFKDQKSANVVRKQLADLSRKINADISPVYTSRKIKDEIKIKEDKPPLVSQQCVVYSFQCSLCDAGYVGYTCRHLHQRTEEHKGSAIGNHLREQHDMEPEDIAQSFRILRKCQNKFDCLIFEMFFIQELKPTLNKQCDSIRAKRFKNCLVFLTFPYPVLVPKNCVIFIGCNFESRASQVGLHKQKKVYCVNKRLLQSALSLACVASVSNRVIARKLEREQKKKGAWKGEGEGRRGEEETAFPSFPSPSPVNHFFRSCPNFLDELARKRFLRRLVYLTIQV